VKDEDDDAGSMTKKPKKAGEMADADMKTLYATNKLHSVSDIQVFHRALRLLTLNIAHCSGLERLGKEKEVTNR
jgi:hypothetical protein